MQPPRTTLHEVFHLPRQRVGAGKVVSGGGCPGSELQRLRESFEDWLYDGRKLLPHQSLSLILGLSLALWLGLGAMAYRLAF